MKIFAAKIMYRKPPAKAFSLWNVAEEINKITFLLYEIAEEIDSAADLGKV